MKLFIKTVAALIIFIMFSCGPSVVLTVDRPAEINLSDYKTIAIGDFVSERGNRSLYSLNIEEALTHRLFETGAFEIVDRQNIDRLMEEHSLSLSGLVDESSALEIGKLMGSAVLIFGRITENEYVEQTTKSDEKVDMDGNKYHIYQRNGKYSLRINIRLVDVTTGKILATRPFEADKTARRYGKDEPAPEIDENKLFRECVDDIGIEFARMVAPYEEEVIVRFESDRDLPELDAALTSIKIDDWDHAINTLRKATMKPEINDKTRAKAYYNYGLVIMYDGQYENAIEAFRKAMQLRSGRNRYQQAIIKARKEKQKREELEKQIGINE